MCKDLVQDQDLICVLGALIIAKAKQQILDLVAYIHHYSAKDINAIWDVLDSFLSNSEKDWFCNVLMEASINGNH